MKRAVFYCLIFFIMTSVFTISLPADDLAKRKEYLAQLQRVLPQERPEKGRVSILDETWQDWLTRTGELPPNFDSLPYIPQLPDPLVLEQDGMKIPIQTFQQWQQQKQWIRKEIKHWRIKSMALYK